MDSKSYDQDQIRRYLRGEMEDKERQTFENELAKNADLSNEVQFQRVILQGLEAEVKEEARAHLQKARANRNSNPGSGIIRLWQPYLAVAALLALAIGILALVYWNVYSGPNSKELFAEHFTPYPNTLTEETRDESKLSTLLDSAMYFYSGGEYNVALGHLKEIAPASRTALTDFYIGNAYLATEQPEKAVQVLEQVQGKLPARYEVQGKWYLALAHIKQENIAEARRRLSELSNGDDAHYKQKAAKLLSQLSASPD